MYYTDTDGSVSAIKSERLENYRSMKGEAVLQFACREVGTSKTKSGSASEKRKGGDELSEALVLGCKFGACLMLFSNLPEGEGGVRCWL